MRARAYRLGPCWRVAVDRAGRAIEDYPPAGARALAAQLVAAADEADRLTAEARIEAMPPGAGRFVAKAEIFGPGDGSDGLGYPPR